MNWAIGRFEDGLRLFLVGAISSVEIVELANEARCSIGQPTIEGPKAVHEFFVRVARQAYRMKGR